MRLAILSLCLLGSCISPEQKETKVDNAQVVTTAAKPEAEVVADCDALLKDFKPKQQKAFQGGLMYLNKSQDLLGFVIPELKEKLTKEIAEQGFKVSFGIICTPKGVPFQVFSIDLKQKEVPL